MKKKWVRALLSLIGLILLVLALWLGPVVKELYVRGFFDQAKKHAYSGDSAANLKAQYTALMLYHESEGQFPIAKGWMDAIQPRLATNDLKKGDWQKKLIRPDLVGNVGEYGYAMNDAASAKYKGDLPKPAPILIFESDDLRRNAHGPASSFKTGSAITADGKIVSSAQ